MQPPTLRTSLLRPGQRIAVAVSGGADSVALLRRLLEERPSLGRTFRCPRASRHSRSRRRRSAAFVAELAAAHELPFHLHRTDAPAAAATLHETLEEAARNLRYAFFRQLMVEGQVDAVATAHTLDDQAETVLHKLLRGAWTEGLSGIHPVLEDEPGSIVRPFLDNSHAAIQAWLLWLPQPWREDASNQDVAHTRNRIRLQLLPLLRTFNPRIAEQLARLASISADEEDYWQQELGRLMPSLLLPGRPSRGGGRSASTHPEEETVGMELARLHALHPAVSRRVLRAAARGLGARLSFEHTERLLAMADLAPAEGSRARKAELPGHITVERSLREIRLTRSAGPAATPAGPAYEFVLPGEIRAPEYGVCLRGEADGIASQIRRITALEGRRSGNAVPQPGSKESCRGSRPAPRDGRSAKKLARSRVGRRDCLDARG